MPTDEQDLNDDTATNPSGTAESCADSMAALFGSSRAAGMAGIADEMMAKCRRMFEGPCEPTAPSETDEPATATEAVGPCTKGV